MSNLPALLGIKSVWLLLLMKIGAALGFIFSANLVMLYAC